MRQFWAWFKLQCIKLTHYLPSHLPYKSVWECEAWIEDILNTHGLPKFPSYKQALASHIMHLPASQTYSSKMFFVKSVKKAMANQVAFEVIQQIKDEQDKAKALAKDASDNVTNITQKNP